MKLLLFLCLFLSLSSTFAGEAKSAGAQAVNNACAEDAKLAGCEGEKVGTGLLKCLGAYKKAHKQEFKLSEGCKESMKSLKEENKAKREAKKEAKKEETKEVKK
jgi:hypothetical protein